MRKNLNINKVTKIGCNYIEYLSANTKDEVINNFLSQIKKSPDFSLKEYSSEEKFKVDLKRKIFGDSNQDQLIDIIQHVEKISNILETIFKDSLNILFLEGDIEVYILPFCNEQVSKDLGGVNGFLLEGNILFFLVDLNNKNWQNSLKETIPHEFAHLVYTSNYQWNSILDGLVNEGLAEHFRIQIVGGNIAPWSKAIPREKALEELRNIPEERLSLFIDESNVDLYLSYFFGTKDLPNWYGYSLGYWMIDEILLESNLDLLELFKRSPKDIMDLYNRIEK